MDQAEADARALWAVRVLDAFAELHKTRAPAPRRVSDHSAAFCFQVEVQRGRGARREGFFGSSEDAARLAAAEAVFPELPEAVRRELGAKP